MNLSFTNVSNRIATMLVYKHIGVSEDGGYGVDGNSFAQEVMFINDHLCSEVDSINVRINSIGGSVQDGLSICASILNSKIPVNTYIDGMAYSIAGVIALCGRKRFMSDYGTFMMHDVSGSGKEDVIDLITNSLAQIFENNSKLTLEKARELMKRETWMDASECLEHGIVDQVVPTNKKRPVTNSVKELQSFYNQLTNPKIKMNKLTSLLKLSNDASEDSFVSAVEAIQADKKTLEETNNSLQEENNTLKAKIKEFTDAEEAKEKANLEAVVNKAIEEGKIAGETAKEMWMNKGIKSNDLKNLFDSLRVTPAHVPVLENVEKEKNDRSTWTYRDWEKKDSAGLLEMKNNSPEKFNELLKSLPINLTSKNN